MKHDIYLFPTVEEASFQIVYPNLSQEPWVSFELSDGSKSATISLSKGLLERLTLFLQSTA
jgi:hypothetical protein